MTADVWEQRYRSGDMPWEKGAPSPGLVDFLNAHPELAPATVCVPGCGTGHDALVWAQAGFSPLGLDIAPSAVGLARKRAAAAGLPCRFHHADFLRDPPEHTFDWVFEHTLFCAIQPSERELYEQAVLRWLHPRGSFLAIHYLIPDHDGPPFGVTRQEVLDRFSSAFDLVDDWVPRSYPNRTGLERMFWWRRRPAATRDTDR